MFNLEEDTLLRLLEEIEENLRKENLFNAQRLAEKGLELFPDNPRLLFKLSLIKIKLGLYNQARELLKKLVEIEPWNLDAIYNLALSSSKIGDMGEAVAYYRTYLRKREDPEGYNNLGIALDRLNRLDEALEAYSKAISLKPDNLNALINRGNLLAYMGKLDEALEDLKRAESINPNNYLISYSLGTLYFLKREYDRAIEYLEKAVSLNPYYSDGFYTLADIYYIRGDYRKALAYYRKTLDFNPREIKALEKALEVAKLGEMWNEILEILQGLQRELPPRLGDKVKLYKAIALLKKGDSESQALKLLDELIDSALVSSDIKSEALKVKGQYLLDRGDERGLELLLRSSSLNPNDAETMMLIARHLREKGDLQGAYTQVLKASKLSSENKGILSELLRELEEGIKREKDESSSSS